MINQRIYEFFLSRGLTYGFNREKQKQKRFFFIEYLLFMSTDVNYDVVYRYNMLSITAQMSNNVSKAMGNAICTIIVKPQFVRITKCALN